MNLFSKEVKIGITAIISVIIIYVGIIMLKGLKLFNTDSEYIVVMDDVNGISISSDVLANGLKIGYVKSIKYNKAAQNLSLALSVNPGFEIPTGTTVFVSKEMLGTAKLNLALGSNTAPPLAKGDTIYGNKSTDLMAAAADMIPQIQQLLPKLDSILTSINHLAADPSLASTLHNLEYTTANLRTATDKMNTMLGKDVPQLIGTANNVMSNAETLTANLNQVDIAAIANNANNTLATTQAMMNKLNTSLNSTDNTLGMLLNDNSTMLHLDTTLINASRLLEDLRQHPKRYVHFSLFGKKEKAEK